MPLQMDIRYPIRNVLGIARLSQFLLGIIVLICIGVAEISNSGSAFVYFVAVASLVTSLIFLIFFTLHFPETGPFAKLPWNLGEFALLALWAVFYLISGIMTAVWSNGWKHTAGNMHSAYGAASFFCFAAAVVYGACAFIYFGRWRSNTTTASSSVTVTERHTTTMTTGARY